MIAILTKYEALVDRVKGENKGRQVAKSEILNYAKKNVFNPLKNVTYVPVAIVQTHRESFISIVVNNNNIIPFRSRGRL